MDSVAWFFIIIGVIIAAIIVFVVAAVAGALVWVFLENGGAAILLGVLLIGIGISLVAKIGGLAGGFGILLSLLGVVAIFLGIGALRQEFFKKHP